MLALTQSACASLETGSIMTHDSFKMEISLSPLLAKNLPNAALLLNATFLHPQACTIKTQNDPS